MAINIAINGMGLIGRELLRLLTSGKYQNAIELRCINDPYISVENLVYLLKHDSVYHNGDIDFGISTSGITVDGKGIRAYQEKQVDNFNFKEYGADYVIDCTGQLKSADELNKFMTAGGKGAMACYPLKDATVKPIVYGVNQSTLSLEDIVCCMPTIHAQVAALLVKVLHENYGVDGVNVNTIAPYMNGQYLMDSENESDFALGRAAAWNVTPYDGKTTAHLGKCFAELNGKFIGTDYRAPTLNGGIVNVAAVLAKSATADEVNQEFKTALDGTVMAYTDDPLVSSDALELSPFQFLAKQTKLNDNQMVAVSAVFDSVRGQALQAIRTLQCLCKQIEKGDSYQIIE